MSHEVKSEIRVNESEEVESPTCLGEEKWVGMGQGQDKKGRIIGKTRYDV